MGQKKKNKKSIRKNLPKVNFKWHGAINQIGSFIHIFLGAKGAYSGVDFLHLNHDDNALLRPDLSSNGFLAHRILLRYLATNESAD